MKNRTTQMRWIIVLGALFLVGILAYSTFQQTHHAYEVCMAFRGSSHCSTATGANYEEAVRSAQEIDCQLLTSGRDENMVCLDSRPTSVRELKKGMEGR
jgi:hypothetical protein